MTAVGLTGGIGSGKSTVGALLADRGAGGIEADRSVHQLQEPGQAVFDEIVRRFGDGVIAVSGELDRDALGSIVFDDPAARSDLEAIVHPAVGVEMTRLRAEAEDRGEVVVLDIPLLAEAGPDAKARWALDAIVVVDCAVDLAVARLAEHRGMSEDDARARMAAQVSRDDRRAVADFVIDNSGDLTHLTAEVDRCWAWIETLRS